MIARLLYTVCLLSVSVFVARATLCGDAGPHPPLLAEPAVLFAPPTSSWPISIRVIVQHYTSPFAFVLRETADVALAQYRLLCHIDATIGPPPEWYYDPSAARGADDPCRELH